PAAAHRCGAPSRHPPGGPDGRARPARLERRHVRGARQGPHEQPRTRRRARPEDDVTASTLDRGRDALRNLPATVLIGVLRVYQSVISPLTAPTCKYYPSCSQYAIIAIRTHG